MADENKGDGKKSNLLRQIITSVAIAILVGGTSPWWFNAFFSKPAPKPTPPEATLNHQEPAANPPQPAVTGEETGVKPQKTRVHREAAINPQEPAIKNQDAGPVASRDFFLGRWRVEQNSESDSQLGNNVVDYFSNGRFEGAGRAAYTQGKRIPESGTWEFEKLAATRPCSISNLCPWLETVLYKFAGYPADGGNPGYGDLIFDQAGNMYGTTLYGGAGNYSGGGCGTVYQLAPSGSGWTESVLYYFPGPPGPDGASPYSGVIFDNAGNLYGTTGFGGTGNCPGGRGAVPFIS